MVLSGCSQSLLFADTVTLEAREPADASQVEESLALPDGYRFDRSFKNYEEVVSKDHIDDTGRLYITKAQFFSSVPQLHTSLSISKMWELWEYGNQLSNIQPVKDYLDPSLRKADFDESRFALWKRMATFIIDKALLFHQEPSKVADSMETLRQCIGVTACSFAQQILPSDFCMIPSTVSGMFIHHFRCLILHNFASMSGGL